MVLVHCILTCAKVFFAGLCICFFNIYNVPTSEGPVHALEVVTVVGSTCIPTPGSADHYSQYELVAEAVYLSSQIALKTALALLFLRILKTPWQRWSIMSSVAVFNLFHIGSILASILQCGTPTGQISCLANAFPGRKSSKSCTISVHH